MSFSNMFRFMSTILRENSAPVLKNQILLRNSYLQVPWSVAASSLTVVTYKRYKCCCFKTYGYNMVKSISSLNKMYIQQKLLMMCLAMDASVRVAIYVCSVRKCMSQSEVDCIPVFEMRLVSKPVRPMQRNGSTRAVEKIN